MLLVLLMNQKNDGSNTSGPISKSKADAKTVFSVLTDYVVCECWHEKNDEGISMDDWAEAT